MNPLFKITIRSLCSIVLLLLSSLNTWQTLSAQAMPVEQDEINIVGGQNADVGEYPWQALLWVLTAAHCVENVSPAQVQVVLGVHDADQKNDPYRQTFVAKQIIRHPNYHNHGVIENDIALIELPTAASFNARVAVIPYAQAADSALYAAGAMATVTGWGRLSSNGGYPNILQEASVPMVSREVCNRPDAYNGSVIEGMVCAGFAEGGKGFCSGDSGRPTGCANCTRPVESDRHCQLVCAALCIGGALRGLCLSQHLCKLDSAISTQYPTANRKFNS
jgi:secreted trypsin-like serine protease